jgi:hypothetical protein
MAIQVSSAQSVTLRQIAVDAPDYSHYRPLGTYQQVIRLLNLEGEATCTLRHVVLQDRPDYYALSYSWGPPTSTKPLEIKQAGTESQVVHIRRTVAKFLKQLYRHFGCISIWLDVICINQRSIPEQSAQVALMGDIYSRAKGVYAWMGGWDPELEYTFRYANTFSTKHEIDSLDAGRLDNGLENLSRRNYWSR